ncbi:hypothetical protein M8C21_001223, partial [Ambrosia artemisiifolia]
MGRRNDSNPFDEGEDVNPFAGNNSNHGGNSKLTPLPQERGTTIEITLDNTADMKAKEIELQVKEAKLKKREEDLKKREEAVAQAKMCIKEKNWPPFYPVIHHDIETEIPKHLQKIQYVAFGSWLGLMVCLAWNFVAVTAAWFRGQGTSIWLLAIIYILTGVPGSYFLWYRPLYRAMSTDNALKFGTKPLTICHIIFCGIAALAPPFFIEGKSLAGILPAFDFLTWNVSLAGIYFIGFGLFALETAISVWVI